jgi:hypothetical protein
MSCISQVGVKIHLICNIDVQMFLIKFELWLMVDRNDLKPTSANVAL